MVDKKVPRMDNKSNICSIQSMSAGYLCACELPNCFAKFNKRVSQLNVGADGNKNYFIDMEHRNGFIRFRKPLVWKPHYQRNNKSNGQKNLRCFPGHCDTGHESSFCGTSIKIEFVFQEDFKYSQLCALGKFCVLDENDAFQVSLFRVHSFRILILFVVVGREILSLYDISEKDFTRRDEPLRMLIEGIPIGNGEAKSTEYPTRSKAVSFEFNGDLKGWHYGYTSSRKTKNQSHIFKVVVLELQDSELGLYKIVAVKCSPPWKLYCRRRNKRVDFSEANARFRLLENLISQHIPNGGTTNALNSTRGSKSQNSQMKKRSGMKKISDLHAKRKRNADVEVPKDGNDDHTCYSAKCALANLLSLYEFHVINTASMHSSCYNISLKNSISASTFQERFVFFAERLKGGPGVGECTFCTPCGLIGLEHSLFAAFLLGTQQYIDDLIDLIGNHSRHGMNNSFCNTNVQFIQIVEDAYKAYEVWNKKDESLLPIHCDDSSDDAFRFLDTFDMNEKIP